MPISWRVQVQTLLLKSRAGSASTAEDRRSAARAWREAEPPRRCSAGESSIAAPRRSPPPLPTRPPTMEVASTGPPLQDQTRLLARPRPTQEVSSMRSTEASSSPVRTRRSPPPPQPQRTRRRVEARPSTEMHEHKRRVYEETTPRPRQRRHHPGRARRCATGTRRHTPSSLKADLRADSVAYRAGK